MGPERVYRSSFLKIFGVFFAIPIALLVVGTMLFRSPPPAYVIAFLGGFVLLFGTGCIVFPVKVSDTGIYCYDGLGRYHRVPYRSMESVSTYPGYLMVHHGKPGCALSIPTYLSRFGDFKKDVIEHAPRDNPLRLHLEGF